MVIRVIDIDKDKALLRPQEETLFQGAASQSSVKLLPFTFGDPNEEKFESLEQQLSAFFSHGWDFIAGTVTNIALHETGDLWGAGLITLRLCSVKAYRICHVKILPIVFLHGYANTISQGEEWLSYYLSLGWEFVANFSVAGKGDGEHSANAWATCFMILRGFEDKPHWTVDNRPRCPKHELHCPQNADCLFCNY